MYSMSSMISLQTLIQRYPFPDYQVWWPVGHAFMRFMSEAIVPTWRAWVAPHDDLAPIQAHVATYLQTVYGRTTDGHLVETFVREPAARGWQSGEFDALSYGFYRHAFEVLAETTAAASLPQPRRAFTRAVGEHFFQGMAQHLGLSLPAGLETHEDFQILRQGIGQVGAFLMEEGYLRDGFAFRFDVDVVVQGRRIRQTEADFLARLRTGQAVALYEMGYPIILPSAVYLFHQMGEAQHHSSRIIEELFRRVGCEASETPDFDPTGFPPELVVELWTIRPLDRGGEA